MSTCKLPFDYHSLKYQDKILNHLTGLYRTNTLPHALLFTGMKGVGKLAVGRFLAMIWNCESLLYSGNDRQNLAIKPCGCCRSCRKITKGTHPDIQLVQPSGSQIKIDQVRSLLQKLSLKPYEANQRFTILVNADSMTPEAGNALLKILEEPPARTTLVLTAGQVSDLLPTIVSRCCHFRLKGLPVEYIAETLEEQYKMVPNQAKAVAAMAFGSLDQARYLQENQWLERRTRLIDEISRLAELPLGMVMVFAEKLARDKENLKTCLEMMKLWFRDLIVWRHTPGQVIFQDQMDILEKYNQIINEKESLQRIDWIQAVQKKIESNGNARMLVESLILKMAGYV